MLNPLYIYNPMAIVYSHKESSHVLSGDKPGIKTQVKYIQLDASDLKI